MDIFRIGSVYGLFWSDTRACRMDLLTLSGSTENSVNSYCTKLGRLHSCDVFVSYSERNVTRKESSSDIHIFLGMEYGIILFQQKIRDIDSKQRVKANIRLIFLNETYFLNDF